MTAPLQIAMAIGSVAVLLGLMAVVRAVAPVLSIGSEMQRKLIHVGTGLYALALPWLFPDRWPVYSLVGVTLLVMLVLRMPRSRLGTTLHGVERQSYGDLLLALSVGLCLFMADDRLYLYVLPLSILTLADAAAALAGTRYGSRFFAVEDGIKSVEGSAVFFTVALLIAITCLMLMTPIAPANILILSVLVAAFGTLVEAVSWRGFDNLFLPLGVLIFLKGHADDTMPEMLVFAAVFVVSIVAFKLVAPRIGLNHHAARVYVITVFLLLAVTEVQNAVLPVLVLAAHGWARISRPCTATYPALDVVAGLALVSFGWLTLGNATGWNAVSFYGVTAMGMMMALCAIACQGLGVSAKPAVLGIIAVASCGAWAVITGLNPASANWNGPMWPMVLACLALAALVPSLAPRIFAGARVARLTVMALAIPLTTYLTSIGLAGIAR